MIFNVYLLSLVCIFFIKITVALPHHRSRRHISIPEKFGLVYEGRFARLKRVSGSIVGTYYYGVGSDPNYGSHVPVQNRPNGGGIVPISYNTGSNLYSYLVNPSHLHQQQDYIYGSNNRWQGQNTNGYFNNPNGRYPPGSQGWYATGGNYWHNKGQSVTAHSSLLIIGILILIVCK